MLCTPSHAKPRQKSKALITNTIVVARVAGPDCHSDKMRWQNVIHEIGEILSRSESSDLSTIADAATAGCLIMPFISDARPAC